MKKVKKLLSVFISVAILCTVIPYSALAAQFTDVSNGAWYKSYVYDLVNQGVINGTSATEFSPSSTLTRAAFATMLAKTALSADDLRQYEYTGSFKDVKSNHWANKYINWAVEAEIVNGYPDNTFKPNQAVSRQEMAVMVTKFANAMGRKMNAVNSAVTFSDSKSIAKFAAESVKTCQQAGVINGYAIDNTFRPRGLATRAEAAAMYSKFLKSCVSGDYDIIRKRVYSTPIRAVEFDSSHYTADVVMGRDVADGGESVTSIVQRSGAKIAINGAFFDMNSYQALGTIIKQGRVITVYDKYAPAKSSLTIDGGGNYSIQNFSTEHTVTLPKEDGTYSVISGVTVNRWPSSSTDGARILFTRDWGTSLAFIAKDAVTLAEDGTVLAVEHDVDAAIPEKGYVLAQRARRQYEGDFFDAVKVGNILDIKHIYGGATTQDINLSIGAGPTLVKNSAVYGGLSTYQAEGFTDPNITTYDALRVCVGIKPNGKIILVTAYTDLAQLSKIMVSLGCTDAINLDGGGSANIYVDGLWLRGPQDRKLNSVLIFK